MNTFDTAESLRDLIEYYCFRCTVGLTDCKISATECSRITQDRDFKAVMTPKAVVNVDCSWR